MKRDLTEGSILKLLLRFSIPYLIASFLQTFYGLADLFITGQFYGSAVISAVSIGSQIMHMLTLMIVGLAMGTTVLVSRCVGAKDEKGMAKAIGNSIVIFFFISIVAVFILLFSTDGILRILSTPTQSFASAKDYVTVCFLGIPFIVAYNVFCSIFRGLGDTKTPMIFVAIAGVINIGLDYLLIGSFHMGAMGAALATVISQAVSVILAFTSFSVRKDAVQLTKSDFKPDSAVLRKILFVGGPITLQEGLIQISFLIITMVANRRGVEVSAAVGIVEKIITFLFLVPSAMNATVSAMTAQNAGAGKHERGKKILFYGIGICVGFGLLCVLAAEFKAPALVGLFVRNDETVVTLGAQYLRSYIFDCMIAGVHFCFSGYFCAYGKAFFSFLQNMVSAACIRIPLVFCFTAAFPKTLFPMGLSAPLGSLVQIILCALYYVHANRKKRFC